MSVKETIHQWIDKLPDDSPGLRDLYEEARLDAAIDEAMEDVRAGRVITFEEMDRRMKEKWAKRNSASN
jgi:predicted transcriptional regulator